MFNIIVGISLIVIALTFNLIFFALQRAFEYPDILRKPTGYVLQQFQAGGAGLIRLWYIFMLSAFGFIPLALMVYVAFANIAPTLAIISAFLGVTSGLVQTLGLLRWSFLVPHLATRYVDPNASQSTRDSLEVAFEVFNQYAGVAIGEHLGYLLTSAWTIVVAIMMMASPTFGAPLAIFGIVSAIGIFVGVFEQAGLKSAATINAISYILWSVWLILSGVAFIFSTTI